MTYVKIIHQSFSDEKIMELLDSYQREYVKVENIYSVQIKFKYFFIYFCNKTFSFPA